MDKWTCDGCGEEFNESQWFSNERGEWGQGGTAYFCEACTKERAGHVRWLAAEVNAGRVVVYLEREKTLEEVGSCCQNGPSLQLNVKHEEAKR